MSALNRTIYARKIPRASRVLVRQPLARVGEQLRPRQPGTGQDQPARPQDPVAARRIIRSRPLPSRQGPVSLADGQRGEHVGEDGVGPGVQLVAGQQLDRMGNVDHAGARHAEPACLLDGFVGERCRRDADRRDAPALQVNQVMQTARRA